MKLFLSILSFITISSLLGCAESHVSSIPTQPKEHITQVTKTIEEKSDFSFEKLVALQNSSNEIHKWVAPNYKSLQLGKATEDDVIKTFGNPKSEGHPFDEEVSTKDEWMFNYESIGDFDGRTEFLFDIRSKVLKEVWLTPNYEKPLKIEKAIEIYGKDYFVRGISKNICSSKKLTKIEYPYTIVYPQKGLFFWIREENSVDVIFYAAKCPR